MLSFSGLLIVTLFSFAEAKVVGTGYDLKNVTVEAYRGCAYAPNSDIPFVSPLFSLVGGTPRILTCASVTSSHPETPRLTDVPANNQGVAVSVDPQLDFQYKLEHPGDVTDGLFLVLREDGREFFLAHFKTGELGWSPVSSLGQHFTRLDSGAEVMTTLFSVTCTGKLVAGIQGGDELTMDILPSSNQATLVPTPRISTSSHPNRGFMIHAPRTAPDDGSLELRRRKSSSGKARCPAWQTAVQKAPQSVPNGCGRPDWWDAPDLNFGSCCDGHDLCFDTCPRGFDECKDEFYNCMST